MRYNGLKEKGNLLKIIRNEVNKMAKAPKSVRMENEMIEYIMEYGSSFGSNNFSEIVSHIVDEFRNMKLNKPAGRKEKEIPQEELEQLVMCMTRKEMAEHYKVSMQTIHNKLKKYGIDKKSLLEKKKNAFLQDVKK